MIRHHQDCVGTHSLRPKCWYCWRKMNCISKKDGVTHARWHRQQWEMATWWPTCFIDSFIDIQHMHMIQCIVQASMTHQVGLKDKDMCTSTNIVVKPHTSICNIHITTIMQFSYACTCRVPDVCFSPSLNACIGNTPDREVEHMQIVYTLLNMHSIWFSNQLCVYTMQPVVN